MLRRILLTAVLVVPAGLLGGCPGGYDAGPGDAGADVVADSPTICPAGFLGDPALEPVIELRALKADGSDVPLNDGDDLAVIFPPQGGRVAFVGIRAINLDACGVQITGALRDTTTAQIRADGRTLNLDREPDGWGTSGHGTTAKIEESALIGNYSNIPLCPNQWASTDVYDKTFELEVLVQDRRKKQVSKKIKVVPRCAEPGAKEIACRCLCKKDYVLGQVCGEDAGTDGGTL
ncbi:MAG TPA: hypothetical protein VLT33_27880 [Labilithrix sp.]|nr:hypothetical protein [Labilithrix sp.]